MYLTWDEKIITDFSDKNVNLLYEQGYVFTRKNRGVMNQTRSIRIDLNKFELSSENKRILRKAGDLELRVLDLPDTNYTWEIGKMGKDFYKKKFGDGTFSANKIKELLTTEHNFNKLLIYKILDSRFQISDCNIGYCIARETNQLLHYSYPFYNLNSTFNNLGMGMMTKAVVWAKENNKKYIYLGSFQRPTDTYKLQFSGMEWWDGKEWKDDLGELKNIATQQCTVIPTEA